MKLPIEGYVTMAGTYEGIHMSADRSSGGITPSACVSARVRGGEACLRLPIKLPFIGREVCLPAPGVPNLGQVSGCCNIRKKWGIPTGVRCCLKFRGSEILCRSFP